MNGPGNMHSKLQILKFATYLRIVVPTGNFVPYDWGETGVMENVSGSPHPRVLNGRLRETDCLNCLDTDAVYHRPTSNQ